MPMDRPPLRTLVLLTAFALAGCHQPPKGPQSLVGNGPAPGLYSLAGDTLTVWRHVRRPDGAARFQAYSITPGGQVDYVDTPEQAATPGDAEEEVRDVSERRQGFALMQGEFEAIREKAALLRPASLGPDDPVGGYGGEARPDGCAPDPSQPRTAGINFINNANWGTFVLQPGCPRAAARAAQGVMTDIFDRLDRAASGNRQARR
jgi:hypothetical protein